MEPRLPDLGRFAEPALLILVSWSDGPKHGYAIMADVEVGAGRPIDPGTPGLPAHRPVLLSADEIRVSLPLGPDPATNNSEHVTFSPDSTRVLITREDGVYLFSIPDGAGRRIDWPMAPRPPHNPPEWQRLSE
ncbi:MAG: hypothetical protein ABIO99_10455 [Candidatus Limnocylindria bacterium]